MKKKKIFIKTKSSKKNQKKNLEKLIKNKFFFKTNVYKKILKYFSLRKTRHFFLNNKSYFNLKRIYKNFFSNRFNRKLIRRIIFSVQFKIIKYIKKRKEKSKRIILLFFFDKIMSKVRKKNVINSYYNY